jgi:hypothetical protein
MIAGTSAPAVSIASPVGVDYAKLNGEIDLNFTVTDTFLSNCWYWYNGTNTSVSCTSGVPGHKSLSLNGTIVNMTNNQMVFYANDTHGNLNTTVISWYYKIFENSRIFNTTTFETALERYQININSTGNSTVTAIFYYDGTAYSATKVGNDFVANYIYDKVIPADIPAGGLTETKNLYWKFSYANTSTDLIYTNSSTQNVNLTLLFGPCNSTYGLVNYSNLAFKDEKTGALINATITSTTWYYWLYSSLYNKSFTYSNTSYNYNYTFCFRPENVSVFTDLNIYYKHDSVGSPDPVYPQRQYLNHNYNLTNTTTNTILYLLNYNDGMFVTIYTAGLNGLAISGTDVQVFKKIGGVDILVASGTTDAAGSITFFLEVGAPHTVTLGKPDCTNQTIVITPTSAQSAYTIIMACNNGLPSYPSKSSIEGVRYFRSPVPGVLTKTGNTTFVYYVDSSSSSRNIKKAMFVLSYSNGTLITLNETVVNNSAASYGWCNISSCYLTLFRNMRIGDDIKGSYWVDIGGGYVLLESDARWRLIQTNISSGGTVKNLFKDLKTVVDSWHPVNETGLECEKYVNSTTCLAGGCYWSVSSEICYDFNAVNRSEYSRIVLVFLLLSIFLAVIGRITGYDAQNPGVFLLFLTVVVAFGTFSDGLTGQGYFYYSDLTPWVFFNNIILLLTVGVFSIGYWASVTRKQT